MHGEVPLSCATNNECDKSNGIVTIPKFEVYETWYTPRWDVHYPQSVGEWDSLDRSHQR